MVVPAGWPNAILICFLAVNTYYRQIYKCVYFSMPLLTYAETNYLRINFYLPDFAPSANRNYLVELFYTYIHVRKKKIKIKISKQTFKIF